MSHRIWYALATDPESPLWAGLDIDARNIDLQDVQKRVSKVMRDEDERKDRLDDFLDWLEKKDIHLNLPPSAPEKMRGGGGDDVFDLSSWDTERVDGRKGQDIVRLGDAFWESDLHVDGSKLVFVDRLTGRETVLKRVEQVEIGGEVFDVKALADALGDGQPPILFSDGLARLKVNVSDPTPSVIWDQVVQSLVAEAQVGPTNASRIYATLHTAIYDAYAAHDAQAVRVSIDLDGDNIEVREADPKSIEAAMHYAGYEVLSTLFPDHVGLLDGLMQDRLDLSPNEDEAIEATIGRDAAQDVLRIRFQEQARVVNDPAAAYSPVNANPDDVKALDAWTPEYVGNGRAGPDVQVFLTPEFPLLEPFALPANPDGTTDFSAIRPPAPEPFFMADFADAQLDMAARTITLAAAAVIGGVGFEAGETIPVTDALVGEVINRAFIEQAEQLVEVSANLTVQDRVVAEFWEDGHGTSYPPGTMMTLAQFVSARDGHDHATDAHLFLAMGNAMFDAAIAAWDSKVAYDYVRPVQAIRDLGELGLIGTPGIDELTGQQGNVVMAFAGYDSETGASLGTRTILAENFVTYQDPAGDFSPPFAEYVSGHSTFSGAAAAVLTALTGDTRLGASTVLRAGGSGFDPTFPDSSLTLSWADFDTAAQEAGMSRIFGGIHFEDGNSAGLDLGNEVGALAAELALEFATGTAVEEDRPFSEWLIA